MHVARLRSAMFAAMASGERPRSTKGLTRRLRASARNALEIARFGRLGDDHGAPFDVVDRGPHHRLRRYAGAPEDAPVALLVPPLMVTAEVYDIAPDVSAVLALLAHGVAPWVVDFGAPEREAGGMTRSLDDHIRAVVRAIARTRELTGRDVHLCGYSQGGMFAYQSAAYLRGEGIRSLVTFGSPVDIHKNLPAVRSDLTGALVRTLFPVTKAVLEKIEGLPGMVTSTAFKLVSTRKEVEQRIDFLRSLHDRERIVKREARRRFIKGEGFVAWPGPAFRSFVEDFVVHNRMLSGGFVIDGRTVSLADLSCPILAFVGGTDELARPATVRAIADAAPDADVRFVTVPAGHFGIVVGSRARETTWPTVAAWISAIERGASATDALARDPEPAKGVLDDDMDHGDLETEIDLFLDVVARGAKSVWRRLGDTLASANVTADAVRWQEPRLRRLARIEPDTRISASLELARRAQQTPAATFFLWRGRAFSYAEADARITNVARGLSSCGVRPGDRVGIVMGSRPSLLSVWTALGRLGAVAVVGPPGAQPLALKDAFERLDVRRVVVDPERAELASAIGLETLILGGGGRDQTGVGAPSAAARDLEAIDPANVPLPADIDLDPGRARDVATVLLRPSEDSASLRAVPVTNHRWALSAIGAAAACAIKPADTVVCAVPLHHPTGLLVSVGSALAGGARLALVDLDDVVPVPHAPLDARRFITEIRRVGATVVFHAGEMLRPLVLDGPASRGGRHLPVRIFAGSGMRPELAAQLRERLGIDTMEFYAGTAHRAILADAAGDAPGSLGGVLPGSAEVALVKCDLSRRQRVLDARGHLVVAATDEPALLAVRVSDEEIETLGDARGLVRDAFGDGAAWLVTNDVLARDAAGRHWFVDALGGFVPGPGGSPVSLRRVEDAFYTMPEVRLAAAWEVTPGSGSGSDARGIAAAFVSDGAMSAARLGDAMRTLPPDARPAIVVRLPEIPLTEGFRPNKRAVAELVRAATERWRRAGDGYEP
ncbi:MAG: AMP-binding protein [Labilithrix sp.]|nr:AMP-binding protein [Labilithrix sp.]